MQPRLQRRRGAGEAGKARRGPGPRALPGVDLEEDVLGTGAVGLKLLAVEKAKLGVGLAVWLPGRAVMLALSGTAWGGCSVITVTTLPEAFGTYNRLVAGLTARLAANSVTAVVVKALVIPSITITLPPGPLVT